MLIRLFWLLLYILSATFPIVFLPQTLNAGGPHYVAGISYFDAGTKGIPLTWTQGSISYYTDQGDLSPLLLRRRLRRGCFQSLDFHHHGGGRHHPGGTAC